MKHRIRTKEEWSEVARLWKESGKALNKWCAENHVGRDSLKHYLIQNEPDLLSNRMRRNNLSKAGATGQHEIVPVDITSAVLAGSEVHLPGSSPEYQQDAIRLTIKGLTMTITNQAESRTIYNTLKALEAL